MIDTDRYEGHTPGPWGTKNAPHNITHLYGGNDTKICSIQTPDSMFAKTKGELKLSRECNTNARLIQDAPLLLEAYKQLRDSIKVAIIDLEQPNMHEETRKDMLDMLKELVE